jgi:hypothetical protein
MTLTQLLLIKAGVLAFLLGALSGCSFQFEVGYHGKTGRDDSKVTESFRTGKKAERY